MPLKSWTAFFLVFTYRPSRPSHLIRRYITFAAEREYSKNQSVLNPETSHPLRIWYKALELRWAIE